MNHKIRSFSHDKCLHEPHLLIITLWIPFDTFYLIDQTIKAEDLDSLSQFKPGTLHVTVPCHESALGLFLCYCFDTEIEDIIHV